MFSSSDPEALDYLASGNKVLNWPPMVLMVSLQMTIWEFDPAAAEDCIKFQKMV